MPRGESSTRVVKQPVVKKPVTTKPATTKAGARKTAARKAPAVGPAVPVQPAARPSAPRRRKRIAKKDLKAHAAIIWDRLAEAHPDAHCELAHRDAFELLCATILSAQCTDKRVNMVTPALFAAYPDAHALARARQEDVEELVKTTGFFRSKAKSLIGMAQALVADHGGEVPRTMAALVPLPGVGRKTANVILGNAFGINDGVTVDTHVARLANRLGLTDASDPVKIEQALMPLFPREEWAMLSHRLIFHGRRICDARKPRCEACPLADVCPTAFGAAG